MISFWSWKNRILPVLNNEHIGKWIRVDQKHTTRTDLECVIREHESRAITSSVPRLTIAGALTIAGFVAVVFGNRAGWLPGGLLTILALVAILGLVNIVAVRGDDALEAQRWRRFRAGGLLGMALGGGAGFTLLNSGGPPPVDLALLVFSLVFVPAAAGFTLGYVNMRMRDRGDKSKVAAKLRAKAAATPSQSKGAGVRLADSKELPTREPAPPSVRKEVSSDHAKELWRTGEAAGFFWFDSRAVSEVAEGNYGRFVYGKILPLLSPVKQSGPNAWCILFDGDCMTSVENLRWYFREEDKVILDGAAGIDENLCYVVAVLGAGVPAPEALDRVIRAEQVPGYLGLSMPSAANRNRNALEKCRMKMALSIAGRLDGAKFKRIDYGYHADRELKEMGFEEIVSNG